MIKILFVCHGNICRSPMAEFVFKNLLQKNGLADAFYVESAATSREEIGNDMYPPAKQTLKKHCIAYAPRHARQVTKDDYQSFDYLIVMDQYNIRNLLNIIGTDTKGKVHMLLEYAGSQESISDPWYTGDFELTYRDICRGLEGFLSSV